MKKRVLLVTVLFLSIATTIMLNTNKKIEINETVSSIIDDKVIKYMNESIQDLVVKPYDFNNFYLLFDEYQLSTKNMQSLFSYFDKNKYEYSIKSIFPYINPIYTTNLSKVRVITYDGKNIKEGIINFTQSYINELVNNYLDGEIDKANTSGISIRMVKINTSNVAMYNFLKQHPSIKYNLSGTGIFKTF